MLSIYININILLLVFCADPGPANGYVTPSQSDGQYPINSTIYFSCDPGYSLSGSSSSICQTDRTWDQQTPTCGIEIKSKLCIYMFSLFTILNY